MRFATDQQNVRSKPLRYSPLWQVHQKLVPGSHWSAVDFCVSQGQLHTSPRQLVFRGWQWSLCENGKLMKMMSAAVLAEILGSELSNLEPSLRKVPT